MSIDVGRTPERLRRGDPRQIGGYVLLGRLGAGGMGVVYLGRSPRGELVAVKVVHAQLARDPQFVSRFHSEVQRARQVPPFCTAEVLDADPGHDPPYLVVEYVNGPSLGEAVADKGPLTPANLHAVATGVASALAAIHAAGVVHRDLKPGNVLLAPGSPKVIDFGIARALQGMNQLTRTDQMVGTVAYMAPERFERGRVEVGPAADVFAWGAVVAYAGLGHVPFRGKSPFVMAGRILNDEPDIDGLSEPMRALVGRALAKNPADRPTARQLLDLLLDQAPGRAGVAQSAPQRPIPRQRSAERQRRIWTRKAKRWRRRPRTQRRAGPVKSVTAGLLVTGLLIGGVAMALHHRSSSQIPLGPGYVIQRRGAIRSVATDKCLATNSSIRADNQPTQVRTCAIGPTQTWLFAVDNSVQSMGRCLTADDADDGGAVVRMSACDGSAGQKWQYTGRNLTVGDRCLQTADQVIATGCTGEDNQEWTFTG